MVEARTRRFERYVAIGDSSTEGLNDFDSNGKYRGWSRRLAARLADAQGGLLYANFGTRSLTTREILDQQLDPAVSMHPDLVTMFSGTNDVLRPKFDPRLIASDIEHMQRTFIENGATVLTFTLPNLTPIMPIARLIVPRIQAMNDAVRLAAKRTGTIILDFASYPVATDARLWHEDRIHANATGHERIADALAFALGLPDTDDAWGRELPPLTPPTFVSKLTAEISWTRRYLLPWIGKGMRARFIGEAGNPARPTLDPVLPSAPSDGRRD